MPVLRQSGKGPRAQSGARPGEDGYILIAVLFLVTLVLIGLAVAAPRMAKSIQRDKEIEAVHRGEQYKRAIQLYYRKFGRYPSSIDQLVDTNNIRFLRKKYTDPITGKDDWRLIHPGQAKVPPMGFFGQPLAGVPGAANLGAHVSGATGASSGTSAFGGSAFGSSMGSSFGSSMEPSTSSGGTDVETPTLGISTPESGNPGTSTGSGPTGASPTSGASSSPFGSASKPFGSTDAGSASPMGIGQIIGVGLPSTKASLLDYKKQDHYNKWEFVYFPIEDQMKAMGAMGAGGNMNGNDGTKSTSPFGNNGSSFGNSNSPFGNSGSSSFGNSGSSFGNSGSTFGSAPSSGTTPPTTSNPQQ
jgi:type II secretory pathway pseudopilin PulG